MACSDNDSSNSNSIDETQTDGVSTYVFHKNSLLQNPVLEGTYMKHSNIQPGGDFVFEYRYVYDDNEIIADDEYSETIRFQIDPNLESFDYTDAEMNSTNITFSKICYCYFPYESARNVAPKGTMEGTKISETEWRIKMNVVFYGEDRRVLDQNFFLSFVQ
jgi:hypothetical protein